MLKQLEAARADNMEEAREITQDFLRQNYEQIDSRLRDGQFPDFQTFE